MQFWAIFKLIGPKIEIIKEIVIFIKFLICLSQGKHVYFKMINDLAFFVIVIFIVSIGFGASLVSTTKEETLNFKMLFDVISATYWVIFGELGLDKINETMEKKEYNDYAIIYAFFLLMIYALVVLLLVNLLIALFK